MKRTTTWLAVMVAAATTATVVTASPSFAATCTGPGCPPTNALGTSTVGYAFFNAETEVLAIHDSYADGYGVAVINYRYDLADIGPYYGWNRDGSGTTTYYYLHMPYDAEIKFYVCPEKGGLIFEDDCGAAAYGYAGGDL